MKKILFINGSNKIGGGELSLLSVAKKYKNICDVISFNTGDFSYLLKENNINSIILNNAKQLLIIKREDGLKGVIYQLKYLLLSIIELRKIIKEYDVIYCNSQKGILLGLLSSLFLKKKVIIHIRDILNNPNISNFQKIIFSLLVNIKANNIIANSYATKNALIDIGVKKDILVIHNGVTIPNIKIENIKQKNKFIIGMFSRISHWKGQKEFVESINILKNAYPNEFKKMEFWIVGDALMTDNDKKYKNEILILIDKYNLTQNIKLFGFRKDALSLMNIIDILVLPSIYPEPFGRVVIEAMLLKKVVIATNQGGVTEIIEHEKSGILVDLKNLEQNIANYILSLYTNKNIYSLLSKNGHLRAIKNFTEEKMLQKIDEIIKV